MATLLSPSSYQGHKPTSVELFNHYRADSLRQLRTMDLDKLANALAAFAVLDRTGFPLHHAQVFLAVAQKGRMTYQEIQEDFGLSNASASRTVNALGQTNRNGGQGFDLLAVIPDPNEGRRFLVRLTPKGEALARQLRGI